MDWALMETWKQQGIPLHIVLRGVEKSFDSYEAKPRKRTVKTLLYCQEEIEAQFAEWVESHVGAAADNSEAETESDKTPFSFAAITEHLERNRKTLSELAKSRTQEDDLSEALRRAIALLVDIEKDFASSTTLDTRKLEDSLTGLERMLNDSMFSAVGSTTLEKLKNEVKEHLKPYRSEIDAAVYKQTFENLLLERLRKQFGMPRLSLFYV
jgi:myosin heavy subunit